MPLVLKFTSEHMSRLHRQIGMGSFQCLHARHLIHTDRSFPIFCSYHCSCIEIAPFHYLLFSLFILFGGEPIPELMRFQPFFLSNRAACLGEIFSTIPRAFISSAISRPVHWLIGRSACDGASHANTAIWHRCSSVILDGFPGRWTSSKRSARANVSRSIFCNSTHLSRHFRAVSVSTLNSSAIFVFE